MGLSSRLQDTVNNVYNALERLSTATWKSRISLAHYLGDGDVALDHSSDLVENEFVVFYLCSDEEIGSSLQLHQLSSGLPD